MKKLIFFLSVALCAFCLSNSVQAQGITVTGVVTDADTGEELIGVNVVVKGTSVGTITSRDGAYSLSFGNFDGVTLVYSYIGYETQEIVVGNQRVINVKLKPSTARSYLYYK